MKSACAWLLACLPLLAGGTYFGSEGHAWLSRPEQPDRVLVFLVGDRSGLDRVEQAIAADRILLRSPDALALVEGRVVARSSEAASQLITQMGWVERRIELYQPGPVLRRGANPAGPGGAHEADRAGRLRALAAKPILSPGEQVFVLQALQDGVDF